MADKWSKHIWKSETVCKCNCGLNRMSPDIIKAAEVARFGVNIKCYNDPKYWDILFRQPDYPDEIKLCITSGSRCQAHNDKPQKEGGAGGSRMSEHIAIPPKPTMKSSDVGQSSQAFDGWFYYLSNGKQIRIDASEVLIYMWDMEFIGGLILYPKKRFHVSTGRRYASWKDLRGAK